MEMYEEIISLIEQVVILIIIEDGVCSNIHQR